MSRSENKEPQNHLVIPILLKIIVTNLPKLNYCANASLIITFSQKQGPAQKTNESDS